MGILDWRILNFLNQPVTLATCMRKFDIFRDVSTFFLTFLFFVVNVAPHEGNSS